MNGEKNRFGRVTCMRPNAVMLVYCYGRKNKKRTRSSKFQF